MNISHKRGGFILKFTGREENFILNEIQKSQVKYKACIINGAIGDFILFDTFLTKKLRDDLESIVIWNPYVPRNPKGEIVEAIIRNNPLYSKKIKIKAINLQPYKGESKPKLDVNWINYNITAIKNEDDFKKEEYIVQHDIWSHAMSSKKNLDLYINLMRNITPSSFYLVDNHSSKLCKEKLCEKYSVLKEKYCVLAPFTNQLRFLSDLDLQEVTKIIKSWDIPVVILSGDKLDINLKGIDVLNLSGKTSVFESTQITKNASGYIGIDSFLSLIASETLPHNNIIVKTKMIGINHKYYYNKVKDVNKIMYKNVDYIKYQNSRASS